MNNHANAWRLNRREGRGRAAGVGLALVLHAGLIAALMQYQPARSAIAQAVPIMVSLVTPPPVEKPEVAAKPLPMVKKVQPLLKPLPTQQRAEPQTPLQPLIASAVEAPAAPAAPATPVEPPAPVEASPRPQPAPPSAIAAPVKTTPANFTADYLHNPAPAYPPVSRRMGEQGRVMLRVLVNTQGTADTVEVKTSSGSRRLDDAALATVRSWRFVPARHGEQPVSTWVLIPIAFTLEG